MFSLIKETFNPSQTNSFLRASFEFLPVLQHPHSADGRTGHEVLALDLALDSEHWMLSAKPFVQLCPAWQSILGDSVPSEPFSGYRVSKSRRRSLRPFFGNGWLWLGRVKVTESQTILRARDFPFWRASFCMLNVPFSFILSCTYPVLPCATRGL